MPWNQLCPTETQQGLQISGSETRGGCQGEENHRRSVSDGTAGVCHYSLMAEHCRCCCERKVLPQHNCCFSSDQNTEIKQSHGQVATKSIVKTYVFLLLIIKHCSSYKCHINILGKGEFMELGNYVISIIAVGKWKHFNAAEGNVMTTITNTVFTVLSHKLCWKMNILQILLGTPRATSSNLYLKQVLRVNTNSNLYLK